MKPFETIKRTIRFAEVIMFACFILGGFCIIFSVYLHFFIEDFISNYSNASNNNSSGFVNAAFSQHPVVNNSVQNFSNTFEMHPPRVDPISFARFFTFNNNVLLLITGIVLVLAGLTIHSLTTTKRTQLVIKKTTEALLTPDEKLILDIILKNNGDITQKELTVQSGLTKVKIFRITDSLESKGIIDKKDYGQTRKILLKSEL
ncbi:Uncharacterised protein [Candidatus Tiddalikarchaeum anstoanum]|nr:Uncharacterised protein [Candidatus Tiddalikarchaeum anstoanum]